MGWIHRPVLLPQDVKALTLRDIGVQAGRLVLEERFFGRVMYTSRTMLTLSSAAAGSATHEAVTACTDAQKAEPEYLHTCGTAGLTRLFDGHAAGVQSALMVRGR